MAGAGPRAVASAVDPTPTRFSCPREFWVYLELNLTTLLIALKVLTSKGNGSLVTKKVSPSAQGGVVRDPLYWNKGVVSRCLIRGAKSRGPVSVTVPGTAIFERFSVTAVKSSVVVPSSESWKVTARTAIPPEPSVEILD